MFVVVSFWRITKCITYKFKYQSVVEKGKEHVCF